MAADICTKIPENIFTKGDYIVEITSGFQYGQIFYCKMSLRQIRRINKYRLLSYCELAQAVSLSLHNGFHCLTKAQMQSYPGEYFCMIIGLYYIINCTHRKALNFVFCFVKSGNEYYGDIHCNRITF